MVNLTTVTTFVSYAALVSVLLVILAPTPLHMVFFGVVFYVSFGSLFILNDCDFVGVVLVIVYAGALMVMFFFVLMLFNTSRSSFVPRRRFSYLFPSLVVSSWFIYLCSVPGSFLRVGGMMCTLHEPSLVSALCLPLPPRYPSIVSGIAFTFYPLFPAVTLLCGLGLVVGLVGAVGLAHNSVFLPLKRRLESPARSPCGSGQRVVLVRSKDRTRGA